MKRQCWPNIIMHQVHFVVSVYIFLFVQCSAQVNRPPEFMRGGDMDKFTIREDTPVGASVYTLRAHDPENTRVSYYISGDVFTAEKDTGVVRLVRPLDRETEDTVDAIITVTDQRYRGLDPNTISIRREITVLDQNDNPPKFLNLPYSTVISEVEKVGSVVFRNIVLNDADIGINAEIELSCAESLTPVACDTFQVHGFRGQDGRFQGEIILKRPLDHETRTSYKMTLLAEDLSPIHRLNTTADVEIEITDVQDQPPQFLNAPFTATVMENSPQGTFVLRIAAKDGDSGNPRKLVLMTQHDDQEFFGFGEVTLDEHNVLSTDLITHHPMDREDDSILDNGGLYVFQIKAIELINGEPVGESAVTNVTIVIGDRNDQLPVFNEEQFDITVPEGIPTNTPLPGLNIVVSDMDVGDNAKFTLSLLDVENSEGVFSVFPTTAVGRTPVIIRVADSARLDYEMMNRRKFSFEVQAEQNGIITSCLVTITLSDVNDNSPVFESDQYIFKVPESAKPNTSIITLPAYDADSGIFGDVKYSLKGYGSDKLEVDPYTGEIRVTDCGKPMCLDYEAQKGYSLTYEARDGGGRVTTVNLFIEVLDVNDNPPQFGKEVYSREVQEHVGKLLPPLFMKATDADGQTQGGGKVMYRIASSDLLDTEAVAIDENTGEVILRRPIRFSEVFSPDGLVTVVMEAVDMGNPPLTSSAKLILKVKKENDGAPEFVNQPYKTTVLENAIGGTSVYRVIANDPDGPDSSISYFVHGGTRDNFLIDARTGLMSVSLGADLDRELYGSDYHITVLAVDTGSPIQQTATATVHIVVEDVNNKPPKFIKDSYVQHVSENLGVGEEVITVTATDPDQSARLRYSIVEPISARDKTGATVKPMSAYNYKEAFRIDATNGKIMVNRPLDYNSASAIILTIEVMDLGAIDLAQGNRQKDTAEVTVYMKAEGEMNPVFSPPWTPAHPFIEIIVPEEAIIGSTLLTVSARNPLTHQAVSQYEKFSGSDPENYVSVSPVSGVVALNRRLDYEELIEKKIEFKVTAIVGDAKSKKISEATIIIRIQDINDNSPVFLQNSYTTSISELSMYPKGLLTVVASDKDSGDFGHVRYSVSGEGSDVFDIDPISGTIHVRENSTLDRETQSVYNLQVTATDNTNDFTNQRKTSVLVVLKILDENDNSPVFSQEIYSAVVPENVPTGFSVVTIKATDADTENNGRVYYIITDDYEDQPVSYFSVDSETGVVSVVRSLAGKGRIEPYRIKIRATDKGTLPLHSDCHLLIVVADISSNDGVPQFIRPSSGEVAYIHENATVGTEVFQVVAFDPDNPNTANGKVAYKIQDDHNSEDNEYEFAIDGATGIIQTRAPLDRELKENYTMIIVAHDFGFPPQESQRVLRIYVVDVDDNVPQFIRPLKSLPIEMRLKEEVPIGFVVGKVRAVDEDIGTNAVIDYYIIHGNDDGVFDIRRTMENEGEIIVQKRIDHELITNFVLTIKVSKPSVSLTDVTKSYDYQDLSELQVSIVIEDIDDNPPIFDTTSYVLGARVETDVESELLTLKAIDPDSSSGAIVYSIKNTTFIRPSTHEFLYMPDAFHMDPKSGVLSNSQTLGKFVGGHFDIVVEARSSPGVRNMALAQVKLHVLQDRDLLKFVFYKRPSEVRDLIPQFQKDLIQALSMPVSLNIYDTQFYTRGDGSLDFESTSSCFQLLDNNMLIEPKNVLKILDRKKSSNVAELYSNYSVVDIENCAPPRTTYKMNWTEILVLVIAGCVGLAAFIVSICLCVLYSKYQRKLKGSSYFHNVYMANNGPRTSLSPADQQRIYEWQEMNANPADAASFRSYPTLR